MFGLNTPRKWIAKSALDSTNCEYFFSFLGFCRNMEIAFRGARDTKLKFYDLVELLNKATRPFKNNFHRILNCSCNRYHNLPSTQGVPSLSIKIIQQSPTNISFYLGVFHWNSNKNRNKYLMKSIFCSPKNTKISICLNCVYCPNFFFVAVCGA